MKPLVVGEAPARLGDPRCALEGRCGRRLAACCGLTLEQFCQRFARVNLLARWPGAAGKGARFHVPTARRAAARLRRRCRRGRLVLLLGRRVATAFGVRPVYFVPQAVGLAQAVVVPHPSGVNRWFNDPANRLLMDAFMRQAAVYRPVGGLWTWRPADAAVLRRDLPALAGVDRPRRLHQRPAARPRSRSSRPLTLLVSRPADAEGASRCDS